MLATLTEIAAGIMSASTSKAVVENVVEGARGITDTDKAILVLTHGNTRTLDFSTMVTRGRMGAHLQDWWEARLQSLATAAFSAGTQVLDEYPYEDAIILGSPVVVGRRPLGLLCAINSESRPFTEEQAAFVQILSAFAAAALENARLAERGNYALLASERDRIAREMHDGVVQSLFSISLSLEVCKKQVRRDADGVAAILDRLQEQINNAMSDLRRVIYDLRPMKLGELGLVGAVEYWVTEITRGRPVFGSVVVSEGFPQLTGAEEACLYRVAKESVSNVVRHAGATSFSVELQHGDGWASVTITDNGDGFDATMVMRGGTEGLGLKSSSDRVAREGGTLTVTSVAGAGTTVHARLPVGGS
jgi:signal transduction histidine kinase